MAIPSPSNPNRLLDGYLESLLEELLQLWHVGVRTYDYATNWAFMMRASLMWTVNDLPAYEIASRWSTAGVMGCPVCMDDTRAYMNVVEVTSLLTYFVNGYNFQSECHNTDKSTINCGLCVKSSSYTDEGNDFYGIIEEIIQLTYPLIPNLHIVLFKCRWVDPVRGMKVNPWYHLVDVNFKKLYQKDDPFILAQQAVQV
ncbi:UNVERIFIED_CONTAM: hypothetical protein Sradi_5105200 [Sesamum radiatum]|uniref:DUF4216 domain-containing protein n=1 Tax=Sesamum radiatum TaxID=300843 RepID=A0AAW2M3F4_SESRA